MDDYCKEWFHVTKFAPGAKVYTIKEGYPWWSILHGYNELHSFPATGNESKDLITAKQWIDAL